MANTEPILKRFNRKPGSIQKMTIGKEDNLKFDKFAKQRRLWKKEKVLQQLNCNYSRLHYIHFCLAACFYFMVTGFSRQFK